MSIRIPSPSMVFNHNIPKLVKYTMDKTFNVSNIADIFLHLIRETKENGAYKSLVINAHGWPAHIYYGPLDGLTPKEPDNPYYVLSWENGDKLTKWRFPNGSPRVGTIYITSCDVVSFTGPRDGNLFCGWMAKQTKAHVIASNAKQKQGVTEKGQIDDYKGDVWEWLPNGSNRPWSPPG